MYANCYCSFTEQIKCKANSKITNRSRAETIKDSKKRRVSTKNEQIVKEMMEMDRIRTDWALCQERPL